MVTVCHAVDDLELLFLKAALEADGIPHFVVGEHFGSLYPGMQIPWYNERSVRVPPSCVAKALEVVAQVRATYAPAFEKLTAKSRLRMLFEAVWFGWVVPAGKKKREL